MQSNMVWEVELKFPLRDDSAVHQRLAALGVVLASPIEQVDCYFAHPARRFEDTDEALRLRQVGTQNFVTYKGPKIDLESKTRRELELSLPDGAGVLNDFAELLAALGFRTAGSVRKRRQRAQLVWQGHCVEVAFDDVERLGRFIELELAADDQGLTAAAARLRSLAAHLGLENGERRSYLELIRATGATP